MTHRAEAILAAITTKVTGLVTTGSNVVRGRVYPNNATAALSVDMGQERIVGEPNVATVDVLLDIDITAHAKSATGALDTALNQIHLEVEAALMADVTQGLPYVKNTIWAGRDKPDRGIAEKNLGEQTITYTIHYRRPRTSAAV